MIETTTHPPKRDRILWLRRLFMATMLALAACSVTGPVHAARIDADAGSIASARSGRFFPERIPLPNGFRPEGIAIRGVHVYVGSLVDGAIYRGDVVTGRGSVLAPGTAGTMAVGLEIDERARIWTAGGSGGGAVVYDAHTGERLAAYQFVPPDTASFVNDAVATRDAVYFTDSQRPFLYVVPLGHGGRLPDPSAVRALPLTGGAAAPNGFNNGIEDTPTGRLLVVQSATGRLYSVDPATGASEAVELGGASLVNGDGIIRRGRTLHVVQNRLNQVAVIRFDRSFTSGEVVRTITDPALDVPATGARFGPYLYVVNARFTTPPTPTTTYDVIRLRA